jgi:hypothetical protein
MVGAQDKRPSVDGIIDIPSSYFSKIEHKYTDLEDRVNNQTKKYLHLGQRAGREL